MFIMKALEQAASHPISFTGAAPDFFEGALLGNGGLGVVVTTRPDAVLIHFGHNNVWDIRIAEEHKDEIGTFSEVYNKLKSISGDLSALTEDAWYRDYCEMTGENYRKAYPRPMPCGSLLLQYDRRTVEVLGHTVHISNGLCRIDFLIAGRKAQLELFVDHTQDRLWMRSIDEFGEEVPLFHTLSLIPDPETPKEFPQAAVFEDRGAGTLAFTQLLPYAENPGESYNGHHQDKAFRLSVRSAGAVGSVPDDKPLSARLDPQAGFSACAQLWEGASFEVAAVSDMLPPGIELRSQAQAATEKLWQEYWNRSAVRLEDEFLERIWYHNLYFFNCSVKEGVTCPGLFANWSFRNIGSSWHGDYHMNYNTQQPFWLAFSSNHLDKHLPYVDMVDHVLPVSRKWAKEYYGLRGAYYPHSAYPVEMTMIPYPVPHWGWEICETPWTVQSLWWHYLYSGDESFLRERAFVPMKEAVLFMADYMNRPEARGEQWGDDKAHIFPTVVPELYELSPGFAKNSDCLVDLTLTKFLFEAFIQACTVLGAEENESDLLRDVKDILEHFPAHPTAESSRGTVFVSVWGEDPEVIYNVPNTVTPVFPGEEFGLHSDPDSYQISVNSYLNHRNEGGNELVFYHFAGARLGILDLERFKRQIQYCLLPNGTCTDRVLLTGGRYHNTADFDFMSAMGIWFENFSLPAVINECLLQSYNGVLRLFPNWPKERNAEFRTLRAVGGFLVSAAAEAGEVKNVEIISEAGSLLKFYIPWQEGALCIGSFGERLLKGEVGELPTTAGEVIRIVKNVGGSLPKHQ
ncbi:hypothetical protein PF010_g20861 [Phytophthora fragariae]|uniref:Glycosyl hydrolase family 95 catalytic domain-containing protein n=1 Tax=Phytophthora fragariae TaxID=53985 RepID=A0A6G0KDX3_9STRA|nr:hypothetical protein PF010_g20861 [Phytophthora fragariae]